MDKTIELELLLELFLGWASVALIIITISLGLFAVFAYSYKIKKDIRDTAKKTAKEVLDAFFYDQNGHIKGIILEALKTSMIEKDKLHLNVKRKNNEEIL